MRTKQTPRTQFHFHFSDPENLILVETNERGVLIRAACDNFSAHQKKRFLRHLAAEGFIPDCHQWFEETDVCQGVRWVTDDSWLETRRQGSRFMVLLSLGAVLLWLILIASLVFFRAHPALSGGVVRPLVPGSSITHESGAAAAPRP